MKTPRKKTAKKKTEGTKAAKDIPLKDIPDSLSRKSYTDAFKIEAANRVIAGESAEAVAAALNIPTGSLVSKWAQRVREGLPVTAARGTAAAAQKKKGAADHGNGYADMAAIREALERAVRARDERLEVAAAIVEFDGNDARESKELAKRIRAMKRAHHPPS